MPEYSFNINNCLDKAHEGKSFADILKLPPSALEGLAEWSDEMFRALHIHTIKDLGTSRIFRLSRAIITLADREEDGERDVNSVMNINKALSKKYETKSLREIGKLYLGHVYIR